MLSVCRFNDFIKRSRTSKLLLFIHLIPEKMLNKALQLISAFSFIIILLGCSEDTERFRSEAPHFARLTAKSLSDGSSTLRVGQPFVLTAEQEVRGKRLDRTNYRWEVANAADWTQRYTKNLVYDKQPQHPTDTLVATTPGVYRITFTANYNPSGVVQPKSLTYNLKDGGGTVSLNASAVKLQVVLTQTIRVR